MSFYNMPPGCLGPSDIDHYAALGRHESGCEKCKQDPCECSRECNAGPDEACERWCGFPSNDDDLDPELPHDYLDEPVEEELF